MTRYDWENDPTVPPANIYDADGKRWGRLLNLDTETGEAERLEPEHRATGGYTETTNVKRVGLKLKTPVRVEPK